MSRKLLLIALIIPLAAAGLLASGTTENGASNQSNIYPVPRDQTVVFETDTNYTVWDKANPFIPNGTQWGSGWNQVSNEWDWYINYATGEKVLWRTTGWEYSADNMQLTWHVRPGVTWNDGQPYTADDIVFTVNMLKKDPTLVGAESVSDVASVSEPDKYTVVFKFNRPTYRFQNNLRMWGSGLSIRPKHIWENVDPKTYANWPPVETGPFKLKQVYQDLKLFVWERDPNYWGTKVMNVKPADQYFIGRMAPPPDLDLADFVKNNVDAPLPHIFTYPMLQSAQKQSTHVVTASFMDAVSQGFTYNTAQPYLHDPQVRWALQYVVNRQKAATVYSLAKSTAPTMWPWPDWAALHKWEFPEIKNKYGPMLTYDPQKAASMLDQLGYKKGSDGMRTTPDGKKLTLTLLTRPAPDIGFSQAQDVSDELKKVGIDNNLRVVDSSTFGDLVDAGQYDLAFDVLDIDASFPNDVYPLFEKYSAKYAQPIGTRQNAGDRMRSRLQSPALDAITAKLAVMSPDSPQYADVAKQGLDIWYQQLPSVPITEKTFVQTFSDKYWTNWPSDGNMYDVPYQWWPEFIFVLFKIKPAM